MLVPYTLFMYLKINMNRIFVIDTILLFNNSYHFMSLSITLYKVYLTI